MKKMEKLAKILRGLIFATVEAGQSGHPGGSSSKVEQLLALICGAYIAFDPADPKNPGRDRFVWSAGHCTPLLFSALALIYEVMRRSGRQFSQAVTKAVFPENLVRFRHVDGPQGHAENYYPLSDATTGPSGHGLSIAGGMAITHQSCGLDTKVWVMMGDAESEEGISYEARNILAAVGAKNLIVSLDYNHFGIDGNINEVISSPYVNHWLGMGWNVIEVDGHNFVQLLEAYKLAAKGFKNNAPVLVLAHTIKGKHYGSKENSNSSHGSPVKYDEYVEIMKKLGFDVPGSEGNVMRDIEVVLNSINSDDEKFVESKIKMCAKNIKFETVLVASIKKSLNGRPILNPRNLRRPKVLPAELQFKEGEKISTRKAAQAWIKWMMENSTFVYAGAGDLSGSVLTNAAENVYGIITPKNKFGRGIRFGIAEQNMAMMSAGLTQDILPGGFQPVSIFGTYATFMTMVGNCVRLALIGNHTKPETSGFFVMLASHDGPETGEDGPTHHGTDWMSLYLAMPGIKVYKPMDANETIEMLFYALEKGEPIVISLSRPDAPVLLRNKINSAVEAINGAYVYKNYANNNKQKLALAISGSKVLENTLQILPALQSACDIKILVVTSPQLFRELKIKNPKKADSIFADDEKKRAIALHNGWSGFLNSFVSSEDRLFGVDQYLKSGKADEVYELAGLDPEGLKRKILEKIKNIFYAFRTHRAPL